MLFFIFKPSNFFAYSELLFWLMSRLNLLIEGFESFCMVLFESWLCLLVLVSVVVCPIMVGGESVDDCLWILVRLYGCPVSPRPKLNICGRSDRYWMISLFSSSKTLELQFKSNVKYWPEFKSWSNFESRLFRPFFSLLCGEKSISELVALISFSSKCLKSGSMSWLVHVVEVESASKEVGMPVSWSVWMWVMSSSSKVYETMVVPP